MSIRSRGRSGFVPVPNWRVEDPELDPYDFKIACWLFSHADTYQGPLNRKSIADRLAISPDRVGKSLGNLERLQIIEIEGGGKQGRTLSIIVDRDVWEQRPATFEKTPHVFQKTPHAFSDDSHLSTGEDQLEDQPPKPPKGGGVVSATDDTFEAFWAQFPRHRGTKREAQNRWKRLTAEQRSQAVEALPGWLRYWHLRDEPQFVPSAASWLGTDRSKHQFEGPVPPLPKQSRRVQVNPYLDLLKEPPSQTNPYIDIELGDDQ